MTDWNSSASSNWGECPDRSKTTSLEFGISSAIASAAVRVRDRVLHRDEPAVRTARDYDLVGPDPLTQAVHVGRPLRVRERRLALAVAAPPRVEHDHPHPGRQRAERRLRLDQRPDPASPMVGNQDWGALRPEYLDVE